MFVVSPLSPPHLLSYHQALADGACPNIRSLNMGISGDLGLDGVKILVRGMESGSLRHLHDLDIQADRTDDKHMVKLIKALARYCPELLP